MSKKILFVGNDAALMGAPMVLLHFMRWIKANTDTEMCLLLIEGGPLKQEFEKVANVYEWRPGLLSGSKRLRLSSALKRIAGKNQPALIPFPADLKRKSFDIVYLNTAATLNLAPMLKSLYQCTVTAHIHELEYSIQAYFPDAFKPENTECINGYIAASIPVADNMHTHHQILSRRISVFNEFISIRTLPAPGTDNQATINELGVQGKFVIGASGQVGWRKGSDLFIQLAHHVNKLLPDNNFVFIWVGHRSAEATAQVNYEIEHYHLNDKVVFTGGKTNPHKYFSVFDVFVLPSREDPFPLVCLEAAALRKPVLCFKETGGIPDIINHDTGAVFDYGDTTAMAEKIIELSGRPAYLAEMGNKSAAMVQQYDVAVIAPGLYAHLDNIKNEQTD